MNQRDAGRIVIRSRAGDQHATAVLRTLGEAVQKGIATTKNTRAYESIRTYIESHPVRVKSDIGIESGVILRDLGKTRDPAARAGLLARLPLVGGPVALGVAALILAESCDPVAIARSFPSESCALLVLSPNVGEPESEDEHIALWVGRVIEDAQVTAGLRSGVFTYDPLVSWELGDSHHAAS